MSAPALGIAAFLLGLLAADACSFARGGVEAPDDDLHRRLKSADDDVHRRLKAAGGDYVGIVLPHLLSLQNNAFVTNGLLKPQPQFNRTSKLVDVLLDYQTQTKQDLCYWAMQPLPPPMGDGPDFWDFDDGHLDQDIEWVKALSEVAVARLHGLQLKLGTGGAVVNAMCTEGREMQKRRCANGRSDKCQDVYLNDELRWPTAIAVFNISAVLPEVDFEWRTSPKLHFPNLYFTYQGGQNPEPFNHGGLVGAPGDVDPPGMPHGPVWPTSAGQLWGYSPGNNLIAKVVPCSQIPSKYLYPKELYYCDRVAEGGQKLEFEEAYATFKSMWSVFPPTVPCKDDVAKLTQIIGQMAPLILPVKDCAEAKTKLESVIQNFGCDVPGNYAEEPRVSFRDVCCSVCGGEPIPDIATREQPTVLVM